MPDKRTSLLRRPILTSPVGSLRALDRSLGRFINVLLWQVEQAVKRALVVLKVTATVGIKDSGVHHLGKTNALAFLNLLDTARVPLMRRLFCGGPVVFFGTSHAKSGLQHILLTDGEGLDIDYLVLEVLKAGLFVRAFRLDRQAEKSGDRTTNLVTVSRLSGMCLTRSGVPVATLK